MAERILGPTGSKRRKRFLLVPVILVALVALFAIGSAQAVGTGSPQDSGLFQLDGNTLPTTCANPFPATTTTGGDDWAALYSQPSSDTTPCGSDGFTFVNDGVGSADHTYWSQGGSKDANDPALGPWLWKPNDVSPDKNDLDNAFASIYHLGTSKFLYFGSDRFNTNGDAQQGFQFLQADTCLAGTISGVTAGGTAACPASTPSPPNTTCTPAFTGSNTGYFVDPVTGCPVHHTNGDLLILVNFNNGGTLGLAGVFEWSGANGSGGGSYSQVLTGTGANCATVVTPDDFCSIANTAPLGTEPVWPYTAKGVSGQATYGTSAFVEGGVNLSHIPGAGTCFPSFLAETRSSAGPSSGLGLTAQLKDLAFGKFQLCSSKVETTPKDGNGDPIPAGGLSIGTGTVTAKDSALLTIGGATTWTATMKFFLCGPIATGTCDGTTNKGVQIGTTANISDQSPNPVVSSAATLTSAGRYCWRAEFHALTPTGLKDASDSASTECFTVNPVTPSLATQAVVGPDCSTPVSGALPFGSTLYDCATLGSPTSTATQPGTNGPGDADGRFKSIGANNAAAAGGNIVFTLYGPSTTGCGTLDFTSGNFAVSGNNTYGPASFTPDLTTGPGTYHWKAAYTPAANDPNNLASDHNSACDDTNEDVTLESIPTEIKTKQSWYPQDTATVTATSGDLGANGSVSFDLYDNATCSGTSLYHEDVAVTGGAPSEEVGTSNTTFTITTGYDDPADSIAGPYSWKVVYTPNASDQSHTGKQSACDAEHHSITYTNDPGPGTDLP
jgi:hypothetical protein